MAAFNLNLDDIKFEELEVGDEQYEIHSNRIDSNSKKDAVAIIGLSGKAGAAENLDEFWNLLVQGREGIRKLPLQRYEDVKTFLRSKNLPHVDANHFQSTYMTDIAGFDPAFFGISQQEANYMEPNQRIFLETAWKALEDSGYGGKDIEGTNTGVFVGLSTDFNEDYRQVQRALHPDAPDIAAIGNVKSVIASRLAYYLDLKGPSLTIDTACSSGLLAMYYAYRSICKGECSLAIAGSVKSHLIPLLDDGKSGVGIKGVSDIFSSDNKTRTFDNSSDGTTTAEGSFAFVLKSLEEAKQDGDHISAVILGGATNQDGASNGITAPNSEAQKDLITKALNDAGLSGDKLDYIEAHGTGTRLGDPIEIDGIQKALGQFSDKKQFCGIGSLKSNIGHLDHASGLGGLAKLVLAMKNRTLPANLNFSVPNRNISFVESPVYVNDKTVPWPNDTDEVARAGINSFGLSGTNCHLVLESAPEERSAKTNEKQPEHFLLPLGAKSFKALRLLTAAYLKRLEDKNINLIDVVYTASLGRMHHHKRLAIRFDTRKQLMTALSRFTALGKKALPDPMLWYGEHRFIENENKRRHSSDITPAEKQNLENEAKNLISANNADHDLNRLAQLYILGVEFPWDRMMKEWRAKRIPLPTYPFQHRRCWVESKNFFDTSPAQVHPLLDNTPINTIGHTIFRQKFQPENYWELTEHRVHGTSVLPGTAFLEMMVEWAKKFNKSDQSLHFSNIRFLQPFTVDDGTSKELHLLIEDNGSQKYLSFASLNRDNEWIQHAEAMFEKESNIQSNGTKMNVNYLYEHFNKTLNINLLKSKSQFLEVGDRWTDSFVEAWTDNSENEFLIKLELPEKYKKEKDIYNLHPAIMDTGMNGANHLMDENEFYLPISYGELYIYKNLSTSVYVHLKKIDEKHDSKIHRFNTNIYNSNGYLAAEIKNYCIKSTSDVLNVSDLSDGYGYKQVFHSYVLPEEMEFPSGTVVIAGMSNSKSKELKKSLTKKGNKVIEIFPDDNDWDKSLMLLEGEDLALIIFTWFPAEYLDDELESWKQESNDAVIAGFQFLKSWLNSKYKTKLGVIALTDHSCKVNESETNLYPGQAALTGLWKVGRHEYQALNMRCIDCDKETPADVLLQEFADKKRPSFLAYRNKKVYEMAITKSPIPSKSDEFANKDDGIYVLSGGTGDLGLEIADLLAKLDVKRLVLLGQRHIPPRESWELIAKHSDDSVENKRIKQWLELEKRIDVLEVRTATVEDYEQLTQVLSELRSKHGKIKGIFHLAGKAGDGFIYKKEAQTFYDVYLPKVNGAFNLHLATLQDKPEIFITFSSISSLEWNPGQGDYTSANKFLDAFAEYRRHKGLPALSLQWPAWRETGMAKRMGAVNESKFFPPVDTSEGLDILRRVLSDSNSLPAALMPGQMKGMDNISKPTPKREKLQPKQNKGELNNMSISGILEPDEKDIKVAEIWSRTLAIDTVDADDEFEDLGGNSLLTSHLLNEYEKVYPGVMDIADLFTHTTVREQAEYIRSQLDYYESDPLSSQKFEEDSIVNEKMDDVLEQVSQGDLDVDKAISRL